MKNNRKGFTTVELVIVIAVIAILAAVLIPTFSNLIEKAENSAITQETRAAITILLSEKNGTIPDGTYIIYVDGEKQTWFKYENGKLGDAMDTTAVTEAKGYYKKDAQDTADELYAKNNASKVFKDGENAATTTVLTDLSEHIEIFINN